MNSAITAVNILQRINNISSGDSGQIWNGGTISFETQVSDRLQYVVVDKQPSMNADYSDLRFCINPNGTSAEKLFLQYWIETFDSNSAGIWVGFSEALGVGETFTLVFGNSSAQPKSSGYQAFDAGGYYFNDFSRGIDYDIINILGGYDRLLSGDPNGEETWPGGWQNPDDPLHCGVVYKRQDTNLHAGNPTTRTAMRITTDGWDTWGDEFVIDDPGAAYNCTSTSSVAIPTTHPTQRTFETQAGLPWVAGNLGQARASDTQYFDFTVVSYSGTTLVVNSTAHSGTGTFASWVISDRIGATNATITAVKMPNGVVRLIMINSHVDFSISTGSSRAGTKYSDDFGQTWSDWEQRIDEWANVGGQAITMDNGYCLLSAHQNVGFDGRTQAVDLVFLTRDYGVTWTTYPLTLAGVQLDEMGMFQMKDTTTWGWTNQVKLIMRNEETPFHYYTTTLTIDESSISNSSIVENGFYVDEVSRVTLTWCDNRVFGAFGDAREQMVYSEDSGDTWHPVPYDTLLTGAYSARRVYTIMYYLGNGKTVKIWSNNKLTGGADLYINYWDSKLMALHAVATATLTDQRTRPFDLEPGLRINGSLVPGYRSTSTSSISIPTGAGQQRTIFISPGLLWTAGQTGTCVNTSVLRFTFTCISYNSTTGEFVMEWLTNTNTGTFASWTVDLGSVNDTGNLLSNQAFVSTWNRNGKLNSFRIQLRNRIPSTGNFGVAKDETRALAVVTISNAGSAGNVITLKWSTTSSYGGLFTGLGKVASYTVQSGDNIAAVVSGLVASANSIGICPVSTSDGTTLTLRAPRGETTNINGRALTVVTTGTVAGSSGNFSGGTAADSVTAFQNEILFSANTTIFIEQANDGSSQAMSLSPNNYHDYEIIWENNLVTAIGDATTRTKGPATGNGIPDWDGRIQLFITTSVADPTGYLESTKLITKPVADVTADFLSTGSGSFQENSIGNGFL